MFVIVYVAEFASRASWHTHPDFVVPVETGRTAHWVHDRLSDMRVHDACQELGAVLGVWDEARSITQDFLCKKKEQFRKFT